MKDGWFFTGDLVSRDSEDYFYFADRRARMMKVAGMKVYPTEIEEVLKSHPGIAEAVVVKVDDRLHGEIPKALIVAKDGSQLDKNEIRKYCEDRVAKYKAPRVIEFRSELPKTPGGKILWRQLME
jgi:long-chain acyl-CoA synthetase